MPTTQPARPARRRTASAAAALLAASSLLLASAGTAAAAQPEVMFHSPSGRIVCVIDAQEALCENALTNARGTAECGGPSVIEINPTGLSRFSFDCGGAPDVGALAYGRSISRGAMTCSSHEHGMRCKSTRTGHGFELNREHVDRF